MSDFSEIIEKQRKARAKKEQQGNLSTPETVVHNPVVVPYEPPQRLNMQRPGAINTTKQFMQELAYQDVALEDDYPSGDFANQYVVPMGMRIAGPAAYPFVHRYAQAGTRALQNLKMAKDARTAMRANPAAKPVSIPSVIGVVLGEAAFGVAGEYFAQQHEKAHGYIDEINEGHLLAAGMLNSYAYKGFTALGSIMPKALQKYPKGSKLNAAGHAWNTVKTVGGYSIRGGAMGAASAAIDESWKDLTDDEREFLKEWNLAYIANSAVAGAIMDNGIAYSGAAAKRAFNTKHFKKGTDILKRVASRALVSREKALNSAIKTLQTDLKLLETRWSIRNREGALAGPRKPGQKSEDLYTYQDFREEYQNLRDDLSVLTAHKKDVETLLKENAKRLDELDRVTTKRIEEQSKAAFTAAQLKTPKFRNYFGEQVFVNPRGEVLLYKADPGYTTRKGHIALTTKRPKTGAVEEYRIPQKELGKEPLDLPQDGSIVFSTSLKNLKKATERATEVSAGDSARRLLNPLNKPIGAGKPLPASGKISVEAQRFIRGSHQINNKGIAEDIEFLEKATRSHAGTAAGQEADVYARLSNHISSLVYNARRLSDLGRSPEAIKDFEDYLNAVEALSKAAGRADYQVGAGLSARRPRTPEELRQFKKGVEGKEVSDLNLKREAAFKEVRDAFAEFKKVNETARTEAAADTVEELSRYAISARKKKAKAVEKKRKAALKTLHMKMWNMGKTSETLNSDKNLGIFDAVLAARTSTLLTSPDTALLGTASYVVNGLLLNPLKQTAKNVKEAAGLKGVKFKDKVSYATSSTPFHLSRNNYLVQNLLGLFKDLPVWQANARRAFAEGGSSQVMPKYGRWHGESKGSGLTRREELSMRRQQRKEEGKGLRGYIKQGYGTTMDEVINVFSHMGSLLGTADEPFFYALLKSELAAEGERQAIRAGVAKGADMNNYVSRYVQRNLNVNDMGMTRLTNAGDGIKAANATGRAMGRGPAYGEEWVDYRYTIMERMGNAGAKAMSAESPEWVRLPMKFLFPVFKIPVNLTGKSFELMFSPAVLAGRGANKVRSSMFDEEFGLYKTEINNRKSKVKTAEEVLDKLKKAKASPDDIDQANLQLATARANLQKTLTLRNEETTELVGKTVAAFGLFYLGNELAKQGQITGPGSFLTIEQKKEYGHKPYRLGSDIYAEAKDFVLPTGEGGADFRYLDAAKITLAFAADMHHWRQMKEQGLLKKEQPQTIEDFVSSFLAFSNAELPVFSGIVDASKVLRGQGESVARRNLATFTMVPSGLKKSQQVDENLYQEDIMKGPLGPAVIGYGGLGQTGNYKRNWLLEPKQNEALTLPGLMFRSWPKKSKTFTPLDQIALNDSLIGGNDSIITSLDGVASIARAPLEDFIYGAHTLDNAFGDIVNSIRINKAPYKGKTQRQYLEKLVQTEKWRRKYQDGKYTINPDDETRLTNEGMLEIRKVVNDYRKEAKKQIMDKKHPAVFNYINKEGYTIFGYIENLKRTNKQTSR